MFGNTFKYLLVILTPALPQTLWDCNLFFCFQGLGHVIGKSSLKVLTANFFLSILCRRTLNITKERRWLWTMRKYDFFWRDQPSLVVYFWIFKKNSAVMLAFAVFSQYFIFDHSFEDCKQRQNHLNWVEKA